MSSTPSGPVWRGGAAGEEELLARCYANVLGLAAGHELASVAFPAISTGVYGFPKDRAAEIAVAEVRSFTAQASSLEEITFCCFDQETLDLHLRALETVGKSGTGS